jgi:methylglutaconyl-CoA hydratase
MSSRGTARGIRVEQRGRAGWIVLDRHAQRNALDRPCIEALVEGLERLAGRGEVRTVVLAAEGTVFCGGADLKELERGGGREGIRIYARAVQAILSCRCPVIARVQGPAAGGGVGLVAACHLALATPAARFLTPEIRSGLFPLMVHALVESTIGRKRAFAMDLTGAQLSAAEARELGLVNVVVEPGDLDATIEEWTATLSTARHQTLTRSLAALHDTRSLDTLERVHTLQRVLNTIADER